MSEHGANDTARATLSSFLRSIAWLPLLFPVISVAETAFLWVSPISAGLGLLVTSVSSSLAVVALLLPSQLEWILHCLGTLNSPDDKEAGGSSYRAMSTRQMLASYRYTWNKQYALRVLAYFPVLPFPMVHSLFSDFGVKPVDPIAAIAWVGYAIVATFGIYLNTRWALELMRKPVYPD